MNLARAMRSVATSPARRSSHPSSGSTARRARLPLLRRTAFCTALAWFGACGAAFAQTSADKPEDATQAQPADAAHAPANEAGLWGRDQLFGDMGGLRPWLGKYGVTFALTETSELLGNLRGGLARGVAYDGLTCNRIPRRRLVLQAASLTSVPCRFTAVISAATSSAR